MKERFANVGIETVKDFWNCRPCNVRHSQIDIDADPLRYSLEVSARRHFVEPHMRKFAEYERWQGKRVLELGCGIGTDAIGFAQADAQVIAVDLSSESLEIARKRAKAHGLDIEFVQGDIENLPRFLEPSCYDLVYSFGVIHHTPRPERAVEIIRNYMGPKSTLKLMLYNRYSWKVLWIILAFGKGQFWNLDDLVSRHSEAQTGCPITYTFSRRSARELLSGFKIESMQTDFIFPYRIPDYVKHKYIKEWYWRRLPRWMFRFLERTIGWNLLITAKLER
jgi:SAM-dependent methyltransferase